MPKHLEPGRTSNYPEESAVQLDSTVERFSTTTFSPYRSSLKVAPALQPFFPAEIEPIIKTFTKDIEDDVDDKVLLRTVTEEDLMLAYQVFQQKLSSPPYNKLSSYTNQARNLESGEEHFALLSIREKFRALNQILILFTCDGRLSDLSLLLPKDKNGNPSTKTGKAE